MTTTPRTAGLLLLATLAACQPGTSPHPASPALGFSIAGAVSGAGGPVTVSVSGPVAASTTTDAAGRYAVGGLPRGVYAITVVAPRTVAFTPAFRQVTLFEESVAGQDFAGAAVAILQGTISGGGAAGATVALHGPVTREVAAGPGGYYRLDGLPAGGYAVSARGAGFGYAPAGALVTLAPGQVATQDFGSAAQAGGHAISGAVLGSAPAGVILTLSGGASGQTMSDAAGRYRFDGLADGDYRVAPEPVAGHLWEARSRAATLAGADLAGLDFTEVVPRVPRAVYVVAQAVGAVNFVIHQFAAAADGSLTALAPATVDYGGAGPTVADPAGRWLYALDMGAGRIAGFAIAGDGALTPLAVPAVSGLSSPRLLAMDPRGRWLWVHEGGAGTLRRYDLGADGQLAPGASLAVGGATDLVAHPSGDHLYLVSGTSVLHFLVDAAGGLTAASPASAAPPDGYVTGLARMTLDPRGEFAYVTGANASTPAQYAGWLFTFAVGADGALSSAGAPVRALYYSQISFGPQEVVVLPSGRFAYVAPDGQAYYASSQLAPFALGLDGLPAPLTASFAAPLFCPAHLAPAPSGDRLYAAAAVVNGSYASQAQVGWIDVNADGTLTLAGALPIGLAAQSITLVTR